MMSVEQGRHCGWWDIDQLTEIVRFGTGWWWWWLVFLDKGLNATKEVVAIRWFKAQFGSESVKSTAIGNLHEFLELSLESEGCNIWCKVSIRGVV